MRKKLFAVIMSVMMMVTFMPAMAFADSSVAEATKVDWAADYSSATVKFVNGGESTTMTVDVVRHFVDASANGQFAPGTGNTLADQSGANTAFKADTNAGKIVAAVVKPAKVRVNGTNFTGDSIVFSLTGDQTAVKTYWDLKDAEFVTNAKSGVQEMEAADYVKLINQDNEFGDPSFENGKSIKDIFTEEGGKIQVVEPADLAKEDTTNGKQRKVKVNLNTLVTGQNDSPVSTEEVLPRYELYDENTSLDLKVSFVQPAINVVNSELAKQDYKLNLFISNIETVMVKVEGIKEAEKLTTADASFGTVYCGGNQNFQVVSKGVTAVYSTDNQRTWTETAPEITDVKGNNRPYTPYKFDMKLSRKDCKDVIYHVNVTVKPAKVKLAAKSANMGFPVGYTLKLTDIVKLMVKKYENRQTSTDDGKYWEEVTDKTVINMLSKYIKLGNYQSQGSLSLDQILTQDSIDQEAYEADLKKDEALAKFEQNYDFVRFDSLGGNISFGVGYNDIVAPNQTKTFHIKNAAKLKKNKTFKLKATADFGTCKFYKLSGNSKIKVASNGKVTAKKGLKKGKYVVKVKVKAPGYHTTKKVTVKVVK